MIQIREDFKLLKQTTTSIDECTLVSIEKSNYQFKIAVLYNPPRINKLLFIDQLDKFLEDNSSPSILFVICGDFNIDIAKVNQLSNNYLNCIFSNGFELGDTKGTRVTDTTNTCLDHFIYQNLTETDHQVLENQNFSDQFPILLQWTLPYLINRENRLFRDLQFIKSKHKSDMYINALHTELCDNIQICHSTDPSESFNSFPAAFNKITTYLAPMRINRKPEFQKPKWFNNTLKNLRTKRNRAHRLWKSNLINQILLENFKNLRSKLEKEIKSAKRKYYNKKFTACIGDSRQTYKLLNDLSGKNTKDGSVPVLESCLQHKEAPSTFDIAERFNNFFSAIGTELKKNLDYLPLPSLNQAEQSVFLYPVTECEVQKIIDNLDNKSSSGDDNINNILVKLSAPATIPYLASLINNSFIQGIFSDRLKRAKVIPMHKSGSRVVENNYRPISLLIVWSKIFERAMHTRIYNYLEKISLIYCRQFGFRSKHSTVDALVDFTEKMRSHGNKSIISFFYDLKKAFDTIEHNILLQKLESYGIRGNTHKWFRSYLNERIQRVEIKGISSNWSTIKCGVPQGSILGPLLFLIYINDLPHACNSTEIVLFADDTNVTAIGQINLRVEVDIIKLNYWLNANKLIINMDKTVQMNLKTSNSKTFQLNNCNIKKEPVIKYLGV